MSTPAWDPWRYRESADYSGTATSDVVGFHVEALDGGIGKVDEASHDVGASYLVVDTGPWIFGKKVVLPAGTVSRVDTGAQTVHVDRTKDEIKNAPTYDETGDYRSPAYRETLGTYYSPFYGPLP